MEPYLTITQINDFIFCPRSIYFSGIYRSGVSTEVYHESPQRVGGAAHKAIDEGYYSTRKDVITGLTVYSERYRLLGKIDILDMRTKTLIERKYSITAVYDGFRYQLYAQYFALLEMGYHVDTLKLYSVKDNKTYPIPLPTKEDVKSFELTLAQMRAYVLETRFSQNSNKCKHCIYCHLCDLSLAEDE